MRQLSWQGYCILLTMAWLMSIVVGISPLRSLGFEFWLLLFILLPSLLLGLVGLLGPVRIMVLIFTPILAWIWQGWHWQQATLLLDLPPEQPVTLEYCVLDWPSKSASWQVRVDSDLGQVRLRGDVALSILRPGDCAQSLVRLRPSPEFQPPWRPSSAWQQLARAQWQAEVILPIQQLQRAPVWQQARHWLWWQLEAMDPSGMVRALVLGSRTAMDSDLQQWLQQLGIFHLLVVSGLHLSLLVLSALWLARCLALPLVAQVFMALTLAYGYTLFAGAGLPVSRAFLMAMLTLLIWYWRQPRSLLLLWLMALSLLTIWQPLAVTQASFWLSSVAVIWIFVALLSGGQWWRVQLAIALGLLPWQLYFGLFVNPWAAVFNLLLAPVVLVLLPLLLFCVALLPLTAVPIHYLLLVLQQLLILLPLELLPLGQRMSAISLSQLILAQLMLLLLLMPNPFPGARGMALYLVLVLGFLPNASSWQYQWLVYARKDQLWLWTQHEQGTIWLLPRAPSASEEQWLWYWQQSGQDRKALLVMNSPAGWQPNQDWDDLWLISAADASTCFDLPQPLMSDANCMVWTEQWLWVPHGQRMAQYAWQQQHHAQWWLLARGRQDASQHWLQFYPDRLKWSEPFAQFQGSELQAENLWLPDSDQWRPVFPWRHPSSRLRLQSQLYD